MAELELAVQQRTEIGKNAVKKLRRNGFIPGVVYCPGKKSVPVSVLSSSLVKVVRVAGYTRLIDLDIAGDRRVVLVKELARDPLKGDVIHVDFQEVLMDKEVQTLVPIVFIGEDKRESDGGVLSIGLRELAIKCLPSAIPDRIEVDVSGLKVGDAVSVKDLQLPDGVTCEADPEEVVVSVALPDVADTVEETQTDEEGREPAAV